MSDQIQSQGTKSDPSSGHGRETREYKFAVDGNSFESPTPVLTGAQIKAISGVAPSFLLYLEAHGRAADQQITDTTSVDLREPGREEFYTSPPATFGSSRGIERL